MQSKDAWAKAADCAARAEGAFDDETRDLFERLRDTWTRLATSFEFIEADDAGQQAPLVPNDERALDRDGPAFATSDAAAAHDR